MKFFGSLASAPSSASIRILPANLSPSVNGCINSAELLKAYLSHTRISSSFRTLTDIQPSNAQSEIIMIPFKSIFSSFFLQNVFNKTSPEPSVCFTSISPDLKEEVLDFTSLTFGKRLFFILTDCVSIPITSFFTLGKVLPQLLKSYDTILLTASSIPASRSSSVPSSTIMSVNSIVSLSSLKSPYKEHPYALNHFSILFFLSCFVFTCNMPDLRDKEKAAYWLATSFSLRKYNLIFFYHSKLLPCNICDILICLHILF